MARRRQRARRGVRPSNAQRGPRADLLLTPQGDLRTFHVSTGAIKVSGSHLLDGEHFARLKADLTGILEWRMVQVTYTWEPFVTSASDHGMIGLLALPSKGLLESTPKDVGSLLVSGMNLRPASARRSVQTSSPTQGAAFAMADGSCGGVYVHSTKGASNTVELGRVVAVVTARVRGVAAVV